MTVMATLKWQHRHILGYLTATCAAALCGEPTLSSLPPPGDIKPLISPAV
jgi:hypothetical protein